MIFFKATKTKKNEPSIINLTDLYYRQRAIEVLRIWSDDPDFESDTVLERQSTITDLVVFCLS